MLCPTCGEKVQFLDETFICNICDAEYDMLDADEYLIPEQYFVSIELQYRHAVIDTRKQEVYVRVNTIRKAQLIAELLNQHFSQKMTKKQLADYLRRK